MSTPTTPHATTTSVSRPAGHSRTAWMFLGISLLVIAVGWTALKVTNVLRYGSLERTAVEQQTYDHPISKVTVHDVEAGDVVIRSGSPADTVVVTRRVHWGAGSGRPLTSERWIGDTLDISVDCPADLFFANCSVDYIVHVPDGTAVDVRIWAGDIRLTGRLADVWADASAGNIDGRDLSVARTRVNTSAGDIALEFVEAPREVSANSSAGDVAVVVPRSDRYRLDVSTSAGNEDISVVQDPDSSRTIHVDASAGNVQVGYR